MKQTVHLTRLGILICILGAFTCFLYACSPQDRVTSENAEAQLEVFNEALAFELLTLVERDEEGNRLISPSSLLATILMLYNSTSGPAKDEIAELLQVSHLSDEEINHAAKSLLQSLGKERDHLSLEIANSIWLNDRFTFKKDFEKKLSEFYEAKLESIEISNPQAADQINDWVKDASKGKIEKIVNKPLPEEILAYLINVVYFNGKWTKAFQADLSYEDSFYSEQAGEINANYMFQEDHFPYLETKKLQAIQLPYADGEMTMQVFLPKEGYSIQQLIDSLSVEQWQIWQESFQEKPGSLHLPKFHLQYETNLDQALKDLGMNKLFEASKDNFASMIDSERTFRISEVIQKTALTVDEEGTEAAAVSSIGIEMTSAPLEEERFDMKVNRPFLLLIQEEALKQIVFIGEIGQASPHE